MSWATHYIAELQAGREVSFRPRGNSMTPRIQSGNLCRVAPIEAPLRKGDIVLCRVRGKQFLHVVTALRGQQVQISNNHGHVNGWCGLDHVYGILVELSD